MAADDDGSPEWDLLESWYERPRLPGTVPVRSKSGIYTVELKGSKVAVVVLLLLQRLAVLLMLTKLVKVRPRWKRQYA